MEEEEEGSGASTTLNVPREKEMVSSSAAETEGLPLSSLTEGEGGSAVGDDGRDGAEDDGAAVRGPSLLSSLDAGCECDASLPRMVASRAAEVNG